MYIGAGSTENQKILRTGNLVRQPSDHAGVEKQRHGSLSGLPQIRRGTFVIRKSSKNNRSEGKRHLSQIRSGKKNFTEVKKP